MVLNEGAISVRQHVRFPDLRNCPFHGLPDPLAFRRFPHCQLPDGTHEEFNGGG